MRERGFDSTGPNLAKSTSGHAGKLNGSAAPALAATGAGAFAKAPLTKACTSECRIRPLGPLPCTRPRSTPSSRANLRTEGLAWGLVSVSSRGSRGTGGAAVAAEVATATCGAAGFDGCGFGGSARGASLESRIRIAEPLDTLSPTLTFKSLTTPAAGEGISIVAL